MVALGEVVEEFHLLAVPRNDGNSITSFLNPICKTFLITLHSLISLIFFIQTNFDKENHQGYANLIIVACSKMIDINGWRKLYNGQFCGNVHHLDNNKPDKLL